MQGWKEGRRWNERNYSQVQALLRGAHYFIRPRRGRAKVSLLLDWASIPYHTVFPDRAGPRFSKEAELDLTIEQGRGSATTVVVVETEQYDIGHVNITNAAQAIAKGVPLKSVASTNHRPRLGSSASRAK